MRTSCFSASAAAASISPGVATSPAEGPHTMRIIEPGERSW